MDYAFGTDTFYPHHTSLNAVLDPMLEGRWMDIQNVKQNAAFLVSVNTYNEFLDVTRDSTGVYRQTVKAQKGYIDNNKFVPENNYSGINAWTLVRKYHYHKYESVERRLVFLVKNRGFKQRESYYNNKLWVEYKFGQSYSFSSDLLRAHGNAKKEARKFTGLKPTVRENLKRKLVNNPAPRAVQSIVDEKGGITGMKAPSECPNLTQAYNLTALRIPENSADNIQTLISCLLSVNDCAPYLLYWSLEPFVIIIGSKYSLASMAQNSTDPSEFYPVTVDPTFGLGPFNGTFYVYRNLKLVSKRQEATREGVHHFTPSPIRIGVFVIHLHKDDATFLRCANEIVNLEPRLLNMKSFGTDGELNVYWSILAAMNSPIHLRDYKHEKQNMKDAMHGQLPPTWETDIFGLDSEHDLDPSVLLDAMSPAEFDNRLERVREKWIYWDNVQGQKMYSIVKEYEDILKGNMLASVRTKAGLGYPPAKFYTNTSESMNNVEKKFLGRSKRERTMLSVCKGTISLLRLQESEDEKAYIGSGDNNIVRPEFKEQLFIEGYWDLSEYNKKRAIRKSKDISLRDLHQATHDASSCSTQHLFSYIGMRPEEFVQGNLKLPLDIVIPMFHKADSLLSDSKKNIAWAPSKDGVAYGVMSKSDARPNHVSLRIVNDHECEVTCTCVNFRINALCAHSIAVLVKERKLSHYGLYMRNKKLGTNLTKLVAAKQNVQMDRVGKKPGEVRRKPGPRSTVPKVSTSCSIPKPVPPRTNKRAPNGPTSTSIPRPVVPRPFSKLPTADSAPVVQSRNPVTSKMPTGRRQKNPCAASKLPTKARATLKRNPTENIQLHFNVVEKAQCRKPQICFGCRKNFNDTDILLIKYFECRPYIHPHTGLPTSTVGNTYYHLHMPCINQKHPTVRSADVIMSPELRIKYPAQNIHD